VSALASLAGPIMLNAGTSSSVLLTNVGFHLIRRFCCINVLWSSALERETQTLGINYAQLVEEQAAAQEALKTYLDSLTPKDCPPAYSDVVEVTARPWRADDLLGSDRPKLRLLSLGILPSSSNPDLINNKECYRRRRCSRHFDAIHA
jgi:hypothetical protein